MKQNKSFKYRFYPTKEQESNLVKTFGCVRFVYNKFLEIRSKAWEQDHKRIGHAESSRMLTQFKKQEEFSFLNDVSSIPLQASLRNLDKAYINFFKKRTKHPTFKKHKDNNHTATYFKGSFSLSGKLIKLAKHKEPLNVSWSRDLPENCKVISIRILRDNVGRFFIIFVCEVDIPLLPKINKTIGIDVGVVYLATMSNGERLPNPNFIKNKQRRLNICQRSLSRKTKGSKRKEKTRLSLSKIYKKICDARQDYIHKFTTKMVCENQAIYVETLDIVKMMNNKYYAKSIGEAAWGMIIQQLEYKCKWYGRTFNKVDKFFPSSKTCSKCGHIINKLPIKNRSWICPSCKTKHDRDINAAINIKNNAEQIPGRMPGNLRSEDMNNLFIQSENRCR